MSNFPKACQVSINLRVFDLFFAVCYLQEPTFNMEPPKKEKKSKKNQRLTSKKASSIGLEVIETVEEAPVVQTAKKCHFPYEKMKRDNRWVHTS